MCVLYVCIFVYFIVSVWLFSGTTSSHVISLVSLSVLCVSPNRNRGCTGNKTCNDIDDNCDCHEYSPSFCPLCRSSCSAAYAVDLMESLSIVCGCCPRAHAHSTCALLLRVCCGVCAVECALLLHRVRGVSVVRAAGEWEAPEGEEGVCVCVCVCVQRAMHLKAPSVWRHPRHTQHTLHEHPLSPSPVHLSPALLCSCDVCCAWLCACVSVRSSTHTIPSTQTMLRSCENSDSIVTFCKDAFLFSFLFCFGFCSVGINCFGSCVVCLNQKECFKKFVSSFKRLFPVQ